MLRASTSAVKKYGERYETTSVCAVPCRGRRWGTSKPLCPCGEVTQLNHDEGIRALREERTDGALCSAFEQSRVLRCWPNVCRRRACLHNAPPTFPTLLGVDDISRVVGFLAILLSVSSLISAVIALFRYKSDMENSIAYPRGGLLLVQPQLAANHLSPQHSLPAMPTRLHSAPIQQAAVTDQGSISRCKNTLVLTLPSFLPPFDVEDSMLNEHHPVDYSRSESADTRPHSRSRPPTATEPPSTHGGPACTARPKRGSISSA
ncbi:hypothetical protein BC826DRAFT_1112514 [Russula brevipes]|nr:hypothetical protein BC826DRAFT_1112514 [Russula brevipes]